MVDTHYVVPFADLALCGVPCDGSRHQEHPTCHDCAELLAGDEPDPDADGCDICKAPKGEPCHWDCEGEQ